MKTVLFVPGFQEDQHSRDYDVLLKAIKHKGYHAEFISINWRRTVVDDWVEQLMDAYRRCNPKHTVLAGFSQGAVTALVTASQRLPSAVWLCSLSPYFAEDMTEIDTKPSWLHYIGARRAERFRTLSFASIAPRILCPVLLIAGAKEHELVQRRAGLAAKAFKNALLVTAPGCAHDVTNRNYMQTLTEHI